MLRLKARHKLVCGDSGDAATVARLGAVGAAHALVSDPPYGLSFMGKAWDKAVPQTPLWKVWIDQLAPGAHILMFSGTRTYHRATCALEDAGVEVRDQMQWLHGQGFPKSHDVSKAIDKAAGAEREVVGTRTDGVGNTDRSQHKHDGFAAARESTFDVTAPATDAAREWDGFGTSLKPANEPICVARKPLDGTVAECVLKYGTGALNIDGARISTADSLTGGTHHGDGTPRRDRASADGDIMKIRGTLELFEQPAGRWPANVILSHSSECVQTGTHRMKPGNGSGRASKSGASTFFGTGEDNRTKGFVDADGTETVEAWDCTTDCPVRLLDEQSLAGGIHSAGSVRGKGSAIQKNDGAMFGIGNHDGNGARIGDSGGASRFFYCAKPARSERGDGNTHATVKPLRLMEYLVKLVTADGQVVLEPFCGSGTTLLACEKTGRNCLAAELDPGHVDIILARFEALTGQEALLEGACGTT